MSRHDADDGAGATDVPVTSAPIPSSRARYLGTCLAGLGVVGLVVGVLTRSAFAQSAASQDWPPFVLVAGLLMIGRVANADGLFATAGNWIARAAPGGGVLFLGVIVLVGLVTAVLNLDTSVAFLTPVLVYTARSRGGGEAPLLYGCLLMSNAGSLFLPGSNLTNLIVLGHSQLNGAGFLARMWAPALGALVVTAVVVAIVEHRGLRFKAARIEAVAHPALGVGAIGVVLATVLVVVLRNPAIAVVGVGVAAVGIRIIARKDRLRDVVASLGVTTLAGLFGIAVALGTLGRAWSWPASFTSHLDLWGTAGVAGLVALVVNNLPAASLLASRTPTHPLALLVGLNLGPNAFVTGSLAWLLWLRAGRAAGAHPSVLLASRIGVVAVPLSMAAAVGILSLMGAS
jgi:arsenical pump membrane protein